MTKPETKPDTNVEPLPTGKQKRVHFSLSGNGGLGKSASLRFMAEYFAITQDGRAAKIFDLDPSAYTLAKHTALDVQQYDLREFDTGEQNEEPLQVMYDSVMKEILGNKETYNEFLIDPGSSGFYDLLDYISRGSQLDILRKKDIESNVHCYITEKKYSETRLSAVKTIKRMAKRIEETQGFGGKKKVKTFGADKIYLWVMQHDGRVTADLENELWYQDVKKDITGLVYMPVQSDAESFHMQSALTSKKTLEEIMTDPEYDVFARQWIDDTYDNIFEAIRQAMDS